MGKCPLNIKAIEYDINGQWKAIGEEKLSRKAQREKEAYKAAKISNGKSSIDTNQFGNNDSDEEQAHTINSKVLINYKKNRNKISFCFSFRIN